MVSTPEELPLGRLEGLGDAVFAIAITLLVLELGIPVGAGRHLLRSLLGEWPSYLAYITSFLTIGVVWLQHSSITAALRAADATLYRLNLLVLLLASFLPFPTKLVSKFIGKSSPERVAVLFYGLTLLALVFALNVFLRYAMEHRRLVKENVDERHVAAATGHRPSLLLYGVGFGPGFVVPTVAVTFYLLIALYLGVPARTL